MQKPGEKTYIILDEANNLVKIGKSEDPKKRLKQFQTANPYNLELIGVTKEGERVLHSRFRKYRKLGEWFEYSEEIKNFVKVTDEERDEEKERELKRWWKKERQRRKRVKSKDNSVPRIYRGSSLCKYSYG